MYNSEIHEKEFINIFIEKEKRERIMSLIKSEKTRKKFRQLLAHNIYLVKSNSYPLNANMAMKEDIYLELKKYGAPDNCWIMCEDSYYDHKEMKLENALNSLLDTGLGFIISCIPGKIAFYQGENLSCILLISNNYK